MEFGTGTKGTFDRDLGVMTVYDHLDDRKPKSGTFYILAGIGSSVEPVEYKVDGFGRYAYTVICDRNMDPLLRYILIGVAPPCSDLYHCIIA